MHLKNMILILAILSGSAHSDNFSYTYLEGAAGKNWLDDRIDIGIDGYSDTNIFEAAFSYQPSIDAEIKPALGVRALHQTRSKGDSELEAQVLTAFGKLPVPVAERLDVIPKFGRAWYRSEVCATPQCLKETENGAAYALEARVWVLPDAFELSATYFDSSLDAIESWITYRAMLSVAENTRLFAKYQDFDASDYVAAGFRVSF